MFWSSVWGGLAILGHWQTYIAGIEFFVISFLPLLVFVKGDSKGPGCAGCLGILLQPAFVVIGSVVFLWTLLPIILGFPGAAWVFPWAVLWSNPWYWTKIIFMLYILQVAVAFVPFVGSLHSVQSMVSGYIILGIGVATLRAALPSVFPLDLIYYPGFWFMAGLVAIGGIFTWVTIIISSFAGALVGEVSALAMPLLGAVFGFLPVFMYGAFIGAQVIRK